MDRETSQTRLSTYLNAVRAGKLVNFSELVKELTKKSVPQSTIDSCFSTEIVKPRKFRVQVLDETSFTNFCERFANSSVESRINSAFYGKSHRSNVSGSYLLLRNTKHTHPVVVWFEEDTFNCPVSQSCIAVLVENLENYIAVDQLSIVLEKCGVSVNINQVDVIYASGNQVTNQLHGPFLQKYEQIFCLFDIDLGALKMYQSLIQLLPDINLNFIYPADIAERLNVSERRMCVAERTGLLSYIGISPEIDQLIQFMRNNGTKLEQETYLDTPD